MTNQEFSNEFDVLYNNIMSNQAPGLDEYEKSVFLTKAQDEIVKSYFDPRKNKPQEGFDGNEKRQIDFSMLIVTETVTEAESAPTPLFPLQHTKLFTIPNRILMFINESLAVTRDGVPTYLTVIPLDYREYNRLMSKPYKRPLKNQAWRILTNTAVISSSTSTNYFAIASILANLPEMEGNYNVIYNTINGKQLDFITSGNKGSLLVGANYLYTNGKAGPQDGLNNEVVLTMPKTVLDNINSYINVTNSAKSSVVELIPGPNDTITRYAIRYVRRPRAIILYDLEGVTLDGVATRQECELDPILHQEILQRAVELAKAAYQGGIQDQIVVGNQSATDKGFITQQAN